MSIIDEIKSYFGCGSSGKALAHYGTPRHSGRYPWGSGENPFQHSGDFLSRIDELKKSGMTETEIAHELGLSTTQYRVQKQLASHERRQLEVDRAKSLRADGKSLNEIAKIMGYQYDSSVRSLLNDNTAERANRAQKAADILKKELKKKSMIDVGAGAEREIGISENTMKEALYILEREGYNVYGVGIPQVTNAHQQSNTKVLCNPEIEYRDVYQNMGDVQSLGNYHSTDGGATFNELKKPTSIDSRRISICYGDEGGLNKDGVIEIRRGVPDLDLGNSHYAQVRILVDGTHYLKGMAMYSDDIPDGVDIVFNTNKKSGTDKMNVLKPIKDDPENPFGALIKANGQSEYIDPKDGTKKLSAINKLKEEGDWDTMSRNLSQQFLSKQPLSMIKKQLDLTYADREAEYSEIKSLTNPTVKKKMLMDFANDCDAAAVHLQAAALPRQNTQVILPISAMKETEVYAPNYKNGEQVALIRFPHGGTFEIPVLTVNNKNPSAKRILGNVVDAVGINAKVAERLSGADFDGDQVTVIPVNNKVRIKSTPPLKDLEGFDPKTQYAYHEGMKVMTKSETQKQMGIVSNLITDMTLRGAPEKDIAKAVKHSMVVIDAEKHKLDYKQSEKDNDIALLKKTYQRHQTIDGDTKESGASTLLSRRKQETQVPERQGSGRINQKGKSWYDPSKPEGAILYKESGRTYVDPKTGKTKQAMTNVSLMSVIDDAHKLSSGHPKENAYADYANKMKAMANDARKEAVYTGRLATNANAKRIYQSEVDSLNAKLNLAALNAPRERRAQVLANSEVKAKKQANPELEKDKKALKKVKQIAINKARIAVGASGKGTRINITDKEWEAIQSGAVSDSKLTKILRYADQDVIRQKATPKSNGALSSAQVSRIKALAASGYTNAEIAEVLGKSTSTVSKYLNS
jgi:DNA-binding CsgD family transcriptional regulator